MAEQALVLAEVRDEVPAADLAAAEQALVPMDRPLENPDRADSVLEEAAVQVVLGRREHLVLVLVGQVQLDLAAVERAVAPQVSAVVGVEQASVRQGLVAIVSQLPALANSTAFLACHRTKGYTTLVQRASVAAISVLVATRVLAVVGLALVSGMLV